MRWDVTKTANGSRHWKIMDEDPTAILKYNSEAHSLRLSSDDKRLFFLEKTGILHTRILLKTEYSVLAGAIHFVKDKSSGDIEVHDDKYLFHVTDNRLILLEKQKKKILAGIDIKELQQLESFELSALIFASALVARKKKSRDLMYEV
ncbi:MAG: hypothetical protein ACXWV9_10625 [Flavisolibacter sp.]